MLTCAIELGEAHSYRADEGSLEEGEEEEEEDDDDDNCVQPEGRNEERRL